MRVSPVVPGVERTDTEGRLWASFGPDCAIWWLVREPIDAQFVRDAEGKFLGLEDEGFAALIRHEGRWVGFPFKSRWQRSSAIEWASE